MRLHRIRSPKLNRSLREWRRRHRRRHVHARLIRPRRKERKAKTNLREHKNPGERETGKGQSEHSRNTGLISSLYLSLYPYTFPLRPDPSSFILSISSRGYTATSFATRANRGSRLLPRDRAGEEYLSNLECGTGVDCVQALHMIPVPTGCVWH